MIRRIVKESWKNRERIVKWFQQIRSDAMNIWMMSRILRWFKESLSDSKNRERIVKWFQQIWSDATNIWMMQRIWNWWANIEMSLRYVKWENHLSTDHRFFEQFNELTIASTILKRYDVKITTITTNTSISRYTFIDWIHVSTNYQTCSICK